MFVLALPVKIRPADPSDLDAVLRSSVLGEPSQRAHEALGFEVVDRCVHFRKSLM